MTHRQFKDNITLAIFGVTVFAFATFIVSLALKHSSYDKVAIAGMPLILGGVVVFILSCIAGTDGTR